MKSVFCLFLITLTAHAAGDGAFFEQKVKPALEARCVACHKAENKKGGLDLTSRETLLSGGDDGGDLVPGKPDESGLYARSIPHEGKKPEMPKKGEALSKEEAEALKTWIAAGAVWPDKLVLKEKAKADKTFWSFLPLSKAEPPTVSDAPAAWRSNLVALETRDGAAAASAMHEHLVTAWHDLGLRGSPASLGSHLP